ncbi:uncharacterized protein K452DRAFT_146558 [Aplosporella prunicola CBS 121167]|uniref:Uncharacterized protein n=1 Tax=Aplosporella prunicola CBS 121167 TaxID=1176127 RepID=A0A6A6BL46_9PEZI|nr:uncharacterized protein K452DRAFT_146558 [Aplosporella prunicola CBS 121167]KAF2144756.1 hypothetical protein K452DRAFT_146558 [Aplosporella prunicola CBS 121167]
MGWALGRCGLRLGFGVWGVATWALTSYLPLFWGRGDVVGDGGAVGADGLRWPSMLVDNDVDIRSPCPRASTTGLVRPGWIPPLPQPNRVFPHLRPSTSRQSAMAHRRTEAYSDYGMPRPFDAIHVAAIATARSDDANREYRPT